MRVIIPLLVIIAASAWGGYAVWARDRIAGVLLYAFSALTALVLLGAFFGLFGPSPLESGPVVQAPSKAVEQDEPRSRPHFTPPGGR